MILIKEMMKMKTNLDALFKTDKKCESEGIWFDVSSEIGFLIKRFGGANSPKVKAAMARLYKPYARMIENDTMPEEDQRRIIIKVFVDSSMLDWKGVEIDGVETKFSTDVAIKFLEGLPVLFDNLMKYASDYSNYKVDVGN